MGNNEIDDTLFFYGNSNFSEAWLLPSYPWVITITVFGVAVYIKSLLYWHKKEAFQATAEGWSAGALLLT